MNNGGSSGGSVGERNRSMILNADQCESRWLAGDRGRFLLNSDHTGGAMALCEVEVFPGGGPPPHMHTREDEMFYVVDGDLEFVKDQATFRARKGFATALPKNVTHTFKNVGSRPARLVVLAMPGGFDRFSMAASQPWTGPRAPTNEDIEKLLAACANFGIEMRPDWRPTKTIEPHVDDRELWVMGNRIKLKVTSHDTGGQASVCEITTPPNNGVPVHRHLVEDEMFYVLEGTCEFDVECEKSSVSAGGFVYVPKGTAHGFSNRGKTSVKMLDYHTPGGFENFFLEIGQPCKDATKPPAPAPVDMARVKEIFRKHGMTLAGA